MIAALALIAAGCMPHLSAGAGAFVQTRAALGGPGLFLDGGGEDVGAGWRWMHDTLVGGHAKRGGNVLVLTAEPDAAYDAWAMHQARFASVRTLYLPACAPRSAIDRAAAVVDASDAVFFEGGDQAQYVVWKGTRLIGAIERLYARGGVVGGTSAGLAIQGAVIFDSVAADRVLPRDEDVATADAVRDPYEAAISFTRHLFAWPALAQTITDTHFARRNRFGRLAAFMARAHVRYGLGIDEGSALVVDRAGVATLLEGPDRGYRMRGVYVLSDGRALRVAPGRPLLYAVRVTHLFVPGSHYDLLTHRGAGAHYTVIVNGAGSAAYSRNPYGTR
ncbi:MAG: cyanophycinase [Candidatus Tyrphobacter sp.]